MTTTYTSGPMTIALYDEDGCASEPFWTGMYLDFEESNRDADEDWYLVRKSLRDEGRRWIGGGAAPLVLIMRTSN